MVSLMSDATSIDSARDRRWLILGVIGLAQLMVVLDVTVMNIALPSAQRALGFTTTFTEQKDRSKAFGIYGAIAAAGGAVGLLLGGALTEYLSWRWTLYVNLIFAGVAFTGGALLLRRQPSPVKPRLDVPGALLVSSAVFCLVYGFSNAAAHLTLAGATMETRREADPLLSREALQARVTDYTAGQDAALGLISPIFADLSGLPPLIIQAGTHEVLLDNAVRLARQAATADVEVTLDITPGVPHVFQAYYPILDEAAAALDRAGQLLSAHFAGAERVTA